ncbi:SPARC-related modular calcium-binding protein 1 [Trichonephila clavipes]|nr:SPARC-related modular calcium-binding protein 1 [Trichonephila clavipes]
MKEFPARFLTPCPVVTGFSSFTLLFFFSTVSDSSEDLVYVYHVTFADRIDKARCEAQRALMLEKGNQVGLFVPECKEDGSYADVQCHVSTGYCWCVDESGKPIRGSSIQNERPNCAQKGKSRS